MKEVEINYEADAVERLQNEIKASTSPLDQAIGKYLLEQLKRDSVLKNCYYEQKIDLKDVVDYVTDQAHDYLGGSSGAVEDKVVFGWVLHYVQDGWKEPDEKKGKKKPAKENHTLTVKEEADLKEIAKEEFLAEEKKKLEEAEKKKAEKLKKAEVRAKKKQEESGQLSLFDFGGEA